jgi:hypothetical protein
LKSGQTLGIFTAFGFSAFRSQQCSADCTAVRIALGPQPMPSTVGWVQKGSALGQLAGQPVVTAQAASAARWQWTWVARSACSLAGLVLVALISRLLARGQAQA